MYEAYWQLQCRPFENGADPRFYYPSEVHQGALLKLRYAVENRRGAALVTGGSGSGKTLLLHTLRRQLPESFAPLAHLVFPQMSSRELLSYLADELAPPSDRSGNPGVDESLRRLRQALSAGAAKGQHAVLAIDEAQTLLEGNALETVRLLLNLEEAGQPLFTLLVVGQPALLPVLERMPALEERFGVKCLLRPLTADETASYVNHRMLAAGARREIFLPDALAALHEITRGNPRRVNRLCDLSLLIGYAEEQSAIAAAQIDAVAGELAAVTPE